MSMVTLVSGGLDSLVVAILAQSAGIDQFPLFIDYGQLARDRELSACRDNLARHGIPEPVVVSIAELGRLLPCGLTSRDKHLVTEAFLPARNVMFLTIGSAFAHTKEASAVAIGLLDEAYSIFPDQTVGFLERAEDLLSYSLGRPVSIVAPLRTWSKADVVRFARQRGVRYTYSCHAGTERPCGSCISCREYTDLEV